VYVSLQDDSKRSLRSVHSEPIATKLKHKLKARGGSKVVGIIVFYSHNPNSIPAELILLGDKRLTFCHF